MEEFGRDGGESYRFERRRVIEGQLLPNFEDVLMVARGAMSLPHVSGVESKLRANRYHAAEEMKGLVTGSLESGRVDKGAFLEKHDRLALVQQRISSMRAAVAQEIHLRSTIDRLGRLYQLNSEAAADFYRDDTEEKPTEPTLMLVGSAFSAHGSIVGVFDEILRIEDEPADYIGTIRHHINNLSTRRYHRDQLLFIDRVVELLHITISERDRKLQDSLRQDSYQYVMSDAYERLRQSLAQLNENL